MKPITVVLIVAMLAVAGCGSSKSSSSSSSSSSNGSTQASTVHFAKTKFVLHAGLAFGAFHRYIYKPFKAGKLGGPILQNKAAKIKGALAAAFAYHEVKLALNDARSSKVLSAVLAPVLALQTKLSSLKSSLRRGDTSQVQSAQGDVGKIGALSGRAGQPVADLPTPSLGG